MDWRAVHDELAQRPPRTVLRIPRAVLPDPQLAGARVSAGLPRGQRADLRFAPDASCRGLHVQDFGDRWEAHLDQVHPECDLLGHLRRDAPTALALAVAGGGLAFVLVLASRRKVRR